MPHTRLGLLILSSLLLMSGLAACIGVGMSYFVITEPFTLKDGNVVSKTFSLPVLENSKSVNLYLAFKVLDITTGGFRVNEQIFVEFEVSKENNVPNETRQDIRFVLPRAWFKKDNNIVFEHLSGKEVEILLVKIEFNEFNTSPYEE